MREKKSSVFYMQKRCKPLCIKGFTTFHLSFVRVWVCGLFCILFSFLFKGVFLLVTVFLFSSVCFSRRFLMY